MVVAQAYRDVHSDDASDRSAQHNIGKLKLQANADLTRLGIKQAADPASLATVDADRDRHYRAVPAIAVRIEKDPAA